MEADTLVAYLFSLVAERGGKVSIDRKTIAALPRNLSFHFVTSNPDTIEFVLDPDPENPTGLNLETKEGLEKIDPVVKDFAVKLLRVVKNSQRTEGLLKSAVAANGGEIVIHEETNETDKLKIERTMSGATVIKLPKKVAAKIPPGVIVH